MTEHIYQRSVDFSPQQNVQPLTVRTDSQLKNVEDVSLRRCAKAE